MKIDNLVGIFPNPNQGSFVLSVVNGNEKYSLEIYNILGAKISTENLSQKLNYKINIPGQPNGIYLFKLLEKNGNQVGEGKLIIEK